VTAKALRTSILLGSLWAVAGCCLFDGPVDAPTGDANTGPTAVAPDANQITLDISADRNVLIAGNSSQDVSSLTAVYPTGLNTDFLEWRVLTEAGDLAPSDDANWPNYDPNQPYGRLIAGGDPNRPTAGRGTWGALGAAASYEAPVGLTFPDERSLRIALVYHDPNDPANTFDPNDLSTLTSTAQGEVLATYNLSVQAEFQALTAVLMAADRQSVMAGGCDQIEVTARPIGGLAPFSYGWVIVDMPAETTSLTPTVSPSTDQGSIVWSPSAAVTARTATIQVTVTDGTGAIVTDNIFVTIIVGIEFAFQSAGSAAANEVVGTHDVIVRLRLPGGELTTQDLTVQVQEGAAGSATSGTDYTAITPTTLTFAAGSANGAMQPFGLGVLDDGEQEGNETVNLILAAPSCSTAIGTPGTHRVTITDDDVAQVGFSGAASATADETEGFHVVSVRLEVFGGGTLPEAVTVNVVDVTDPNDPGTATSNQDYDAIGIAPVTFPAGSHDGSTQNFSVRVRSDGLSEGNETVSLELTGAPGKVNPASSTHDITITDDDVTTVAFQNADSATGSENLGAPHPVTVVLSVPGGGVTLGAITVEAFDRGTGSATSGAPGTADYDTVGTVTLTFPAGSADGATQDVGVVVNDDVLVEGNETVELGLRNVVGAAVLGGQDTHTATITDDEVTTVAFTTAASTTANEAAGNHAVTATLSVPGGGAIAQAVTVDVTDAGTGTATSGVAGDYSAVGTETLTFPAGSADGAVQTFNLAILADTLVEGDETVELRLGNVGGPAFLGAPSSHTVTIDDDDVTTVAFAAAASATANEAAGNHAVTVNLTVPAGGTTTAEITVDVTDAGTGTATSGADYTALGTVTLTFPAGSASASLTVNVAVLADGLVEGAETVDLRLGNLTGEATLGAQSTHAATITDDDTATVEFASATSGTGNEEETDHVIVVALSVPGGGTLIDPIVVNVDVVAGGTATAAADYTDPGTVPVTFPAGSPDGATQAFSLRILDDTSAEGDETVNLLMSAANPAVLGAQLAHTVTIVDDDAAMVSFQSTASATPIEVVPGGHGVVVVLTIPGGGVLAPGVSVTVDVTDAGTGTATPGAGNDYTLGAATQTFGPGSGDGATSSFLLTTLGDALVEGDETVNLELTNLTGPATLGLPVTQAHTVTITDDDLATVEFQAAGAAHGEDAGAYAHNAVLTVPGGGTLPTPVTVEITDAGSGTATGGTDYNAVGTITLTFPTGSATGATQPFTVTVNGDTLLENDETINLQMGNVAGPAALGAQTSHQITITDAEAAGTVALAFTNATSDALESGGNHTVTVTLTLNAGVTTDAAITVEVTDAGTGTATSGADYTAVGTIMLVFPPGSATGTTQAVVLQIVDDGAGDDGQTIGLELGSATGPGPGPGPTLPPGSPDHQVTINE